MYDDANGKLSDTTPTSTNDLNLHHASFFVLLLHSFALLLILLKSSDFFNLGLDFTLKYP